MSFLLPEGSFLWQFWLWFNATSFTIYYHYADSMKYSKFSICY